MIITIDGPAGAGKSTVAKMLAKRLGFRFLDTGSMYRAVTWAALNASVDFSQQKSVADVAARISISFNHEQVLVDNVDVTHEIREPAVTSFVSDVADNAEVREHLVMLQREIAAGGDYVCEGRDQGTVVFPDAECKIFLTASNSERAKRRFDQMVSKGYAADYDLIFCEQEIRDRRDLERPVGKLIKADDAIELTSDGIVLDEVVDQIEEIVRAKIQIT